MTPTEPTNSQHLRFDVLRWIPAIGACTGDRKSALPQPLENKGRLFI